MSERNLGLVSNMRKRELQPWLAVVALAAIAGAAWGCCGQSAPTQPAAPGKEKAVLELDLTPTVKIEGTAEECDADPATASMESLGALCFTNRFSDSSTVVLTFDSSVLWGDNPVTELEIAPGATECIRRDPNSMTNQIPYDISVGENQCSPTDPPARPRIIINPPGT